MRRDSFDPPPPPGGLPEPPPPPLQTGGHRRIWWAVGASAVVIAAAVVTVVVLVGLDHAPGTDPAAAAAESTTTVAAPTSSDVPATDSSAPDTTEATSDSTGPGGSGPDGEEPPPAVKTISGLTASISGGILAVAWNDPGDESGYTVTLDPGGTNTLPADVTAFEQEPVPCGVAIAVELVARDASGASLATGRVTAAAAPCGPQTAPPSNLRVTEDPGSELALARWNDATGEVGYAVGWDLTPLGAPGAIHQDAELGADVTQFPVPLPCQGHLEIVLEAIAPDGSRFGRITATHDGPRCDTWDLIGSTEEVVATVVVPGSGLRTVTAACPAQRYLVGGGFTISGFDVSDSGQRPYVIGNRPVGNSWQVTVAARPGRDLTVNAIALCVAGTKAEITERATPAVGAETVAQVTCPAGTVLTGGGWWADPFLDVVHNVPGAEGGWYVQASGVPLSDQGKVIAYAVCMPHAHLTTSVIQADVQVPAGSRSLASTPPCPTGSMLTGGGFSVDWVPASTSMPWMTVSGAPRNDIWNLIAFNPGGSSKLIRSYAVCIAVG